MAEFGGKGNGESQTARDNGELGDNRSDCTGNEGSIKTSTYPIQSSSSYVRQSIPPSFSIEGSLIFPYHYRMLTCPFIAAVSMGILLFCSGETGLAVSWIGLKGHGTFSLSTITTIVGVLFVYGWLQSWASSVTNSLQLDDYHCGVMDVCCKLENRVGIGSSFDLCSPWECIFCSCIDDHLRLGKLGSGNGTKEFRVFLNSDSTSVVRQWSGIGKEHNYSDRGSFHLTRLEGYVAIHLLLIDMPVMGLLAMFPCCFTPIIDGSYYNFAVG
ncbi:hypothetical protein E3N88_26896 [Mikania micrantha]|uniref:Uncharacterized protein n=1 Tax=Mikania micrantha TaxID=192012 RepID=A0A5N6MXU5_9ASTR|nr:hypothetical protein E3N88_26896 [Mikania micrantha]